MSKKMPTLFAKDPPRRPLDSLEAIVDDWTHRFGANGKEQHRRDTVVEYAAKAKTLREAVAIAVNSRRENGKMHNHQCKVREESRQALGSAIMARWPHNKNWPSNFDLLYDFIEGLRIHGIGPVTTYDVATRIAAFLRIEVTSLYLHAGVQIGWTKLTGFSSTNVKRIPRSELPSAFRQLPTDEVEDLICAYRDYLKPWLAFPALVTAANRSRI